MKTFDDINANSIKDLFKGDVTGFEWIDAKKKAAQIILAMLDGLDYSTAKFVLNDAISLLSGTSIVQSRGGNLQN